MKKKTIESLNQKIEMKKMNGLDTTKDELELTKLILDKVSDENSDNFLADMVAETMMSLRDVFVREFDVQLKDDPFENLLKVDAVREELFQAVVAAWNSPESINEKIECYFSAFWVECDISDECVRSDKSAENYYCDDAEFAEKVNRCVSTRNLDGFIDLHMQLRRYKKTLIEDCGSDSLVNEYIALLTCFSFALSNAASRLPVA